VLFWRLPDFFSFGVALPISWPVRGSFSVVSSQWLIPVNEIYFVHCGVHVTVCWHLVELYWTRIRGVIIDRLMTKMSDYANELSLPAPGTA
jgi:hypothetical protein